MKDSFEFALKFVLEREGGFVINPRDPGGMTNMGVTKAVWEAFCRRPVTEDEMRGLRVDDVTPLYHDKYWNALKCDDFDNGLDLCVFDAAVNQGPSRAARMLQTTIGLPVDGIIGPRTIEAAADIPTQGLISDYCATRRQTYRRAANFELFGKGWLARLDACERESYRISEKLTIS